MGAAGGDEPPPPPGGSPPAGGPPPRVVADRAAGSASQFGATRDAALRLAAAHIELARSELARSSRRSAGSLGSSASRSRSGSSPRSSSPSARACSSASGCSARSAGGSSCSPSSPCRSPWRRSYRARHPRAAPRPGLARGDGRRRLSALVAGLWLFNRLWEAIGVAVAPNLDSGDPAARRRDRRRGRARRDRRVARPDRDPGRSVAGIIGSAIGVAAARRDQRRRVRGVHLDHVQLAGGHRPRGRRRPRTWAGCARSRCRATRSTSRRGVASSTPRSQHRQREGDDGVAARTDAARAEVLAARERVRRRVRAARSRDPQAVDIPAKIRRAPVKSAASPAGRHSSCSADRGGSSAG